MHDITGSAEALVQAQAEDQVDRALDHALQSVTTETIDPYVLYSTASTTVEKVALKFGDAFMVTDSRGDLPLSEQETGFFWHGTRFLRPCDLFIEGRPFVPLSHSTSDEAGTCQIDLANPFIALGDGRPLYQGTIHLRRQIAIEEPDLTQSFSLTNFDSVPITVLLGLKIDADYRDIFEVRGLSRRERGEMFPPQIEKDEAVFRYRGLDGALRETRITYDRQADEIIHNSVFWRIELEQGKQTQINVRVAVSEEVPLPESEPPRRLTTQDETPSRSVRTPIVQTDNPFFNRLLTRGMHDLLMMCTKTPEGLYPYGGIPWYACPFGRDGLITSLEFMPWFPEVGRGTLAFLAAHQGRRVDPFTEEEPGRILHEYRFGEMARCREVPFIPYYGTVDATPLFLMALESYTRWTDDMEFLRDHWPNAVAAAQWLREYGDRDGDSFVEYHKVSEKGLVNQGWKDSWDAISHADGALAEGPVALCEVQGYTFAAYRAMAYLAERMGDPGQADQWRHLASTLRANFMDAFWWEEEQTLYMALDGGKRPCKVVSSNAGQALWTGIVPDQYAGPMVDRLMRDDMYTEWGIRTLSSRAARYNPMSYHNGSVWPHDTALVAAGFARYGRAAEAGKLLGNLFGASLYFTDARLPELFCGFARRHGYGPTRYPVACAPQSWAAGAPYIIVSSVLGFDPDADRHLLTVYHPTLPDWLRHVEMRGLRLGDRWAHLRFEGSANGGTALIVTEDADINVSVLHT